MEIDYMTFDGWLVETKNMSDRSARDVVSRCKRVCKMLAIDTISDKTIEQLEGSEGFNNSSMFVKSQLRRAVTLWNEYGGSK